MLNTTQQKQQLYGLLSLMHQHDILSTFPGNENRIAIIEQQYRDELQILVNSLACPTGFDPVANKDEDGSVRAGHKTGGIAGMCMDGNPHDMELCGDTLVCSRCGTV